MEKKDFIANNNHERERLKSLGRILNERELKHVLGGEWTVSAIFAHLAFWDKRALILIKEWENNAVKPSLVDTDIINEAMRELFIAIPAHEAVEIAIQSAEAIDKAVKELTDETMAEMEVVGMPFNVNRASHRCKHLDEIERVLGVTLVSPSVSK